MHPAVKWTCNLKVGPSLQLYFSFAEFYCIVLQPLAAPIGHIYVLTVQEKSKTRVNGMVHRSHSIESEAIPPSNPYLQEFSKNC